jgi:hypothetical protein
MNEAAIFVPMLATMTLTAIVWFYMYARRIPAMRKAGLSAQTYTTPDTISQHLPDVVHCTRNIVMLRFTLYVAAALALWFMLGTALIAALAVYW